jgi:putative ABC transport system substrate-binding protein
MKRRQLLTALALAPLARAWAQPRAVKIGILGPRSAETSSTYGLLVRALAELGYREGGNLRLEYRSSGGAVGREPALARELIEQKCDLIFALGPSSTARAFSKLLTPAPVVFLAVDYNPQQKGIVGNLRHPGGNMTGVYVLEAARVAKQLEVALQVLPTAQRFMVFTDNATKDQLEGLKQAVDTRGVDLLVVEYAERPYNFAEAFDLAHRESVQALIGLSSPGFTAERPALVDHLLRYRLPAFVGGGSMSGAGFLAACAIDFAKAAKRAAEVGARILKGANPADIPVEEVSEFEVIVNLRTAKKIGVTVPQPVLARAARVVQ